MPPYDLQTGLHSQVIMMLSTCLLNAVKAQGHGGTKGLEQVGYQAGLRPSGSNLSSTLTLLTFTDLGMGVSGILASDGNSWQVQKGGLYCKNL